MSYKFATWYPAERCTDGPEPGTRALQSFLLEQYDEAFSLGIYNCRDVAGTSTTSAHGEGRAGDTGVPMHNGRGSAIGHDLVDALGQVADKLGIQAIIYDRTIWSAISPDGRPYDGVYPHYDHVHWEQTRTAAAKLTLATIRAVMGEASGGTYEAFAHNVRNGSRTVAKWDHRPWSAGRDVQYAQRWIGPSKAGPADGYFGPKTEAGVKWYQHMRGIKVDGIVGPVTWSHLL